MNRNIKSVYKTNSKIAATLMSILLSANTATAGNDLMEGLIGGMIGAAIVNSNNQNNRTTRENTRSTYKAKPKISAEQRAKNKQIQTNLNYFDFNTGTPDGIFGSKTRAAISMYQSCLSRPVTGKLDSFEVSFLNESALKAQTNPTETLRKTATLPNGKCGILQGYFIELTTPREQENLAVQTIVSQTPANVTTTTTVVLIDESLQSQYDRFFEQVVLLEQIREHVEMKAQTPQDRKKLSAVLERLQMLRISIKEIETRVESEYGTPIRPTNTNLGITSVKASEVFPRVPYYIPGTKETGELWIKPYVSDYGTLLFDFNFVSGQSELDKINETIEMNLENTKLLSASMVSITRWSDQAQENNVRRRYEKTAACFPEQMCDQKIEGNASTEFNFMIYEDGSTGAAIKRWKGRYSKPYNLSIESGLLLAAYADYVADVGLNDFTMNTMTDTELDAMFD